MIVLDASVVVGWLLGEDGPETGFGEILTTRRLVVPAHWTLEIGNATLKAFRRNRIPEDRIVVIEKEIGRLAITVEAPIAIENTLPLLRFARFHGLTMYDSIYVHMALTHQAELATFENAMRSAASQLGIRVWPA